MTGNKVWTADDWRAFRQSEKTIAQEDLVSPETERGMKAADGFILTAMRFSAEQFGENVTEATLLRLMRRTLVDIRTIPVLRQYLRGMAERSLVSQAGYGRWEAV
ncbi:hypothetical protein HKD24_02995 [Gluconobacter sp. LMG 31484]|uniref:Uncharacterized protein n=1 Tax=Gluconobacter vitians TaxID=2728102 RepID=A0ABR9Y3Y5_9PROT|nr:hypothetical protein [Gluconobacter vitians]MBF0858179.1 hypothetical protein [Gluconobacter vitians]